MRKSLLFEGVTITLLILLIFMLLAMVMGSEPPEKSIPGSDQVQYIYTGGDNTLYMFFDDHIQAIDMKGNELWDFKIPEQWQICNSWHFIPITLDDDKLYVTTTGGNPITFSENGTLYVYMKPNETYSGNPVSSAIDGRMAEGMVAISDKGTVLWSLPLHSNMIYGYAEVGRYSRSGIYMNFSDANIFAQNGKVYVFHDYNETVVDAGNGTIMWSVDNVADPVSVDENNFVYSVPAVQPDAGYIQPLFANTGYVDMCVTLADYRVPAAMLDAYYPNGTQEWRKYPGALIYRQYINDERLPLFNNGTIYAPLEYSIMAFDTNGTEKWEKKYDPNDFSFQYQDRHNNTIGVDGDFRLYGLMPFDSKGDIYIQYVSRTYMPFGNESTLRSLSYELYLFTIGPDGKEIDRDEFHSDKYVAASDGIGFATSQSLSPGEYIPNADNFTVLPAESLIAYNIMNGTELWNYTFPVTDPRIVTIDDTNAYELLPHYPQLNGAINQSPDDAYVAGANSSAASVPEVITSDGRIYAQFYSINNEVPVVYGKSKAIYVSGIYALNRNGSLIWSKAINTNDYGINIVDNSTIFYRANDGKLIVTRAGAAVGFALTTVLYIFIRFFCIGAVARARSRINKNENRNAVYDFIVKNPGSTMYEVSRGLGINIGTVRYHAFILGMNHRIVPYKEDGKYIRYFTNSNSYSTEDQFIVSLLRRDAVGKVLGYMATRPTASNADIAKELGIQESIVSRCVKELSEKGIITKAPYGARSAYTIVDSHRDRVASIMRRIYGQ